MIIKEDNYFLIEEFFKDSKYIVLDYEAFGFITLSPKFFIGGVGLYDPYTEKKAYVSLFSLDDQYDDEIDYNIRDPYHKKYKIWNSLKNLLNDKNKTFIVYNLSYERLSTLNYFDVDLTNSIDILQWVKLLSLGKQNYRTLKDIASAEFNIKNWSEEIEDLHSSFNQLVMLLQPTNSGNIRKESLVLQESKDPFYEIENYFNEEAKAEICNLFKKSIKDYVLDKSSKILDQGFLDLGIKMKVYLDNVFSYKEEFKSYLLNNKEYVYENLVNFDSRLDVNKCLSCLINKREINIKSYFETIEKIFKKYYDESNINEIKKSFVSILLKKIDSNVDFEYTDLPEKILAPYCINDIVYTGKLFLKYKDIVENEFEKANNIFYKEGILASELMHNGIAFDLKLSYELIDKYDNLLLYHLKSLLRSDVLKKEIQNSYYRTLLSSYSKKKLSREEVEEKATQDFKISEYSDSLYEITVNTEIERDNLCEKYFNPQSTVEKTRLIFSKSILSKRFKFGMILFEVQQLIDSSLDKTKIIKKYPNLNNIIEALLKKNINDENEVYNEVLYTSYLKAFDFYANSIDSILKNLPKTREEDAIILKYSNYDLESLDIDAIEKMYLISKRYLKVDIDKLYERKDVYPYESFLVYHFGLYKKIFKITTSFIQGKPGYQSLCKLKKDDYKTNRIIREKISEDYFNKKEIEDDNIYIVNSNFIPSATITKRFQSFIHSVPWNCEVQDLRSSRFKEDGIRIHLDYSQMEICILAGLSQEKELIDAINNGKDIHRFIAAKSTKKKEEEITDAVRRARKGATFSILFLSGIDSFARKYTNGDKDEARKIINDFFVAFPNILNYVKKGYERALYKGNAVSFFGDILNIGMTQNGLSLKDSTKKSLINDPFYEDYSITGDWNKDRDIRYEILESIRCSQNYPIQSSATHIAASSIYDINKFIKDNNYDSKIDCFTHDSCDIDTRIEELFDILDALPKYFVEEPRKSYNVPIDIDIEIGVSGNQMIGIEKISDNEFRFEGKLESINKLTDKFPGMFNFIIEKEKEKFVSFEEIFIKETKRAFDSSVGKTTKFVEGKFNFLKL